MAIVSVLETGQAAVAAAMINLTSGNILNILNPSDWSCPINPNIVSY